MLAHFFTSNDVSLSWYPGMPNDPHCFTRTSLGTQQLRMAPSIISPEPIPELRGTSNSSCHCSSTMGHKWSHHVNANNASVFVSFPHGAPGPKDHTVRTAALMNVLLTFSFSSNIISLKRLAWATGLDRAPSYLHVKPVTCTIHSSFHFIPQSVSIMLPNREPVSTIKGTAHIRAQGLGSPLLSPPNNLLRSPLLLFG